MKITNKDIQEFEKIQNEFGYIGSINFSRESNELGEVKGTLIIILTNSFFVERDVLKLVFYDVVDLKTNNLSSTFRVLISIKDVSSFQMENIRYQVSEEENDIFSLNCQNFSFENYKL